ncbi:MAG: hypothetical protein WHX52_21690 [Anaerolineae bacterium]
MMGESDPALRSRIEGKSDELLERAERAARSVKSADLAPDQVQELLRQAQTGWGVEHVCNWLRYQKARIEEWQRSGLADAVLKDLSDLRGEASTIAGNLYPTEIQERLGEVWLALARRYAAYLERWYYVVYHERESE